MRYCREFHCLGGTKMVVELELSVFVEDDRFNEYHFVFVGIDSNTAADILEKEFGFCIEWLNGIDFDVWKKVSDGVMIDGAVSGLAGCDGCTWIVNADEWVFRAVVERILKDVEGLIAEPKAF